MIRTVFHETNDGKYVEVNVLVGSAISILAKEHLPPDTRSTNRTDGAFVAQQLARQNKTYCTGIVLESDCMRNLNNQFINPEL